MQTTFNVLNMSLINLKISRNMEKSSDDLRPFIKRAVVKMAQCARFERAENDALETLVELYGALIQSIAEISREYCEHGNRCIPTIQDIISGT